MRRTPAGLLAVVGLLATSTACSTGAGTGGISQALPVVHTERVDVGPYDLTVGFTRWPIRAMQSLDYTFVPDGGREGLSGQVDAVPPDGYVDENEWALGRHPRQPEVWGLDIVALPEEGPWTFRFTVDGPQGQGVGELTGIEVLPQPGPPIALSWIVAGFPPLLLLGFLTIVWRRARPSQAQLTTL